MVSSRRFFGDDVVGFGERKGGEGRAVGSCGPCSLLHRRRSLRLPEKRGAADGGGERVGVAVVGEAERKEGNS